MSKDEAIALKIELLDELSRICYSLADQLQAQDKSKLSEYDLGWLTGSLETSTKLGFIFEDKAEEFGVEMDNVMGNA